MTAGRVKTATLARAPRSECQRRRHRVDAAPPVPVGLDAGARGILGVLRRPLVEQIVDAKLAANTVVGTLPRQPPPDVRLHERVELPERIDPVASLVGPIVH